MSGKSTVDRDGDGESGAPCGTGDAREADLILFSTGACHLCEEAERLLRPWVDDGLRVGVDDISESDELFDRYGLSIPVLRRCDTGVELNWPFDQDDIARFLR